MDFIFDDKPKEIIFEDQAKSIEITFFYREPTPEECFKRDAAIARLYRGKKPRTIKFEDLSAINFQFGKQLLTGFRITGMPVNISSDPDSPQYREDWKDLLSGRMPDLVLALTRKAFSMIDLTEKNSKNS